MNDEEYSAREVRKQRTLRVIVAAVAVLAAVGLLAPMLAGAI